MQGNDSGVVSANGRFFWRPKRIISKVTFPLLLLLNQQLILLKSRDIDYIMDIL